MRSNILKALPVLALAIAARPVQADTSTFSFGGPGISGQATVTYTPVAGGADKITNVTGSFSDTNAGFNSKPSIVNASITGLYAINPINPLPAAVLAPDFSRYTIVNGVPSPPATEASNSFSYDNTYYPGGSPIVCSDYPASGGALDVYGLLMTLSNGDVVDLWSNGIFPGAPGPADYGVAVGDANYTYDYVGGGVSLVVPEPCSVGFIGLAAATLSFRRRRKATSTRSAEFSA